MSRSTADPQGPARAAPIWRGRMLALAGIVLVAFSLRSAVGALSPIVAEIERDMTLPAWVVGLIGTAPPVCFAAFGLLTPPLERRVGLERLAALSMLVTTVGVSVRAVAPDAGTLLGATIVLFAAVGVGNVVLPPLVKQYFPDRIGAMTALYSTMLAVASFVPPLVVVPLADSASWRLSLGLWAGFAAAAIVPWIVLAWRHRSAAGARDVIAPAVFGRLWRLPVAWALAASFMVSSATAYTAFAWLPIIVVDLAGVSHEQAGALLSLFAVIGLPLSVVVPTLVSRFGRVGMLYAVTAVTGVAGVLGMLVAPASGVVVWVVLLGMPPLLFPAVLTLIQVRTRTHEGSVALSGFAQSVGYGFGALFPLAFGVLHAATGGWTAPLIVLGALMLVAIPAGVVASRPERLEDAWERSHGAW